MTAIVGDFNAYRSLWHEKLPEERKGNNIASEIDLSEMKTNHVVLNEKARTSAKNSCKNYPDISRQLKHSNEPRLAHGVQIRLKRTIAK